MKLRKVLKVLNTVVVTSFIYAFIGLCIYYFVYRSDLILLESIIWLLEAIAFLGSLITLHITTSKTLYGSRYEILRAENLLSFLIILLTIGIVLKLSTSALHSRNDLTPTKLSTYLIIGGILSYTLHLWLKKYYVNSKFKLLITGTAGEKLRIDAVIELGAGLSIVASNLLNQPIFESITMIAISAYILYECLVLGKETVMYLIGLGKVDKTLINRIKFIAERTSNFKVRRLILKTLGSFIETEIWLEAPSSLTLEHTYKITVRTARKILISIPEVIRALVIVTPSIDKKYSKEVVAKSVINKYVGSLGEKRVI